ncbi:MAG: DUF1553 domain-containing protein, partial [Planctomycetota bacterium]
ANEHFAAAMSNRVWKHFMGVGLVEPVDDLRATNPPSNPGLFKALAGEFAGHGHDLRHLIRVIVKSRAYQLTSATLPGNQAETRFYSHYHARRLPAEVLLDAICQATGVPERFDGYPEGVRALQVPDPGVNSAFLRMFGRSERVTACTCERSGEVTMPQLLHLRNGERMIEKLASPGGVLGRLLAGEKDDDRVIDELFLRTLSRLPESAERLAVRKALEAGDPRADVFRDLFWALLNAKSFAFNS